MKKNAFILLLLMSGLYFVSFFQRVAVPGTIFNEIQKDFAATASAVTALGAIYLLVYAGLQPFVGMLADRFGGVKITLISGLFLCLGSVIFPLSGNLWTLYISRIMVGIGASGMYLCIIKETDSLFSQKFFAHLLGFFCIIGYGGGLFGTSPFRKIVDAMGWRSGLLLVAGISVIFLVLIYFAGRAFMGKITIISEKPVLDKTRQIIMNSKAYPLLIAGMINFSIYFSIQATIGPKFVGDFLKLDSVQSTNYTFVMMLFTMAMMFISGNLSRMLGNKRKPFLIFGSVNTMLSVIILLAATLFKLNSTCILIAYMMLAVSGGLTPVTVAFVKELNPRDVAAMSVGLQNTLSYVAVAGSAYLIGLIMDIFKNKTFASAGVVIYPAETYLTIFVVMLLFSIISCFSSICSTETNGKYIYGS